MFSLILPLLVPPTPAPQEPVQILHPTVVESAAEVGIRLPQTLPAQWQQFVTPAARPPAAALTAPWPTVDWAVSDPASQGLDPNGVQAAMQYGQAQGSNGLVVIRNGYIVAEWYAPGWQQDDQEDSFSMSKSVSSALYGTAFAEGIFPGLDTEAADYISEWDNPQHGAITLRHLLSMNSGLHWDFFTDYLFLGFANDQTQFAINLGMDATPGTTWVYNNSACQTLSGVFERRTGHQIHEYAQLRLFDVIGMHNATWLTDNVGNTLTYRTVYASAREFAKFGYLFLRGGHWDGTQVVPRRYVKKSVRPSQTENPFYGYLWWLNTAGAAMADVPADAFYAAGLDEKRIYVVPSQDLVVVRIGPGASNWDDNAFLGPISQAVQ